MRHASPPDDEPELTSAEYADREAALRVRQIGALLREARRARGQTQAQVSEVTGLSRHVVASLEAGRGGLALGRAVLLCEAAGLDLVGAMLRYLRTPVGLRPPLDDDLPEPEREGPAFP